MVPFSNLSWFQPSFHIIQHMHHQCSACTMDKTILKLNYPCGSKVFQVIFLKNFPFLRTSVWVQIHNFAKIFTMLWFFPSRNCTRGEVVTLMSGNYLTLMFPHIISLSPNTTAIFTPQDPILCYYILMPHTIRYPIHMTKNVIKQYP